MGWLAHTEQYTRPVKDPESGEEAEVTFRVLNGYDSALIEDEMVVEQNGMRPLVGRRTLMAVKLAVVRWTLPFPCTQEMIGQLHPRLIGELYDLVSFGDKPPDPTKPTAASTSAAAVAEPTPDPEPTPATVEEPTTSPPSGDEESSSTRPTS